MLERMSARLHVPEDTWFEGGPLEAQFAHVLSVAVAHTEPSRDRHSTCPEGWKRTMRTVVSLLYSFMHCHAEAVGAVELQVRRG